MILDQDKPFHIDWNSVKRKKTTYEYYQKKSGKPIIKSQCNVCGVAIYPRTAMVFNDKSYCENPCSPTSTSWSKYYKDVYGTYKQDGHKSSCKGKERKV